VPAEKKKKEDFSGGKASKQASKHSKRRHGKGTGEGL